jgi:hypothetical protein
MRSLRAYTFDCTITGSVGGGRKKKNYYLPFVLPRYTLDTRALFLNVRAL